MLVSQNFGGCHHTSLITIIQRYQHTHQCHQRFSTAYIPLQQTVHLLTAPHIPAYFFQYTLLGTCQFERQILGIESIEYLSYRFKYISTIFPLPVFGIAENIQLYIKKFFKLQAILRFTKQFRICRKMNIHQSFRQRHQMMFCQYSGRKRFGQRFAELLHYGAHHLLYCMRIEGTPFHFLRCIIIRLQSHCRELQFRSIIDIRMSNVNPSVEDAGFTKYNIFLMYLILTDEKFNSLKPD